MALLTIAPDGHDEGLVGKFSGTCPNPYFDWSDDGHTLFFNAPCSAGEGCDLWRSDLAGRTIPITHAYPSGANFCSPEWVATSVPVRPAPTAHAVTLHPTHELETRRPIYFMAAGGNRVRIVTGNYEGQVGIWTRGVSVRMIHGSRVENRLEFAFAGTTAAWLDREESDWDSIVTGTAAGKRGDVEPIQRMDDEQSGVGNLAGDGPLLVYNSWDPAGLWRIVGADKRLIGRWPVSTNYGPAAPRTASPPTPKDRDPPASVDQSRVGVVGLRPSLAASPRGRVRRVGEVRDVARALDLLNHEPPAGRALQCEVSGHALSDAVAHPRERRRHDGACFGEGVDGFNSARARARAHAHAMPLLAITSSLRAIANDLERRQGADRSGAPSGRRQRSVTSCSGRRSPGRCVWSPPRPSPPEASTSSGACSAGCSGSADSTHWPPGARPERLTLYDELVIRLAALAVNRRARGGTTPGHRRGCPLVHSLVRMQCRAID